MKRLLWLSLALLLLSASPAFGQSPEVLLTIPMVETNLLSCPSGPAMTFENPEMMVRILFQPKTSMIVVLDFKNNKAYLGKVGIVNDQVKYKPREEMTIDEVKVKYPSACNYLEQREM